MPHNGCIDTYTPLTWGGYRNSKMYIGPHGLYQPA